LDNDLQKGIGYYRLKMIDEDGKITFSRTVAVMNGVNGLLLTSLVPAIITGTATLTITSSHQQKLDILIIDMQGKIVRKQNLNLSAGNTNIEIPAGTFRTGLYQLVGITDKGKTNLIRFFKQ
jgi:hypothetical protein